ncbi:MAG: molybdenum cofactor guanylyltransferase [Acidiferrobacteraceae bacterium]
MEPIQGVILAGGQALRMQGRDKGLLPLAGRPLVAHAIERLTPQVTSLAISANGNRERFREFGLPVLIDDPGPVAGPLRGILTALNRWPAHHVLTVAVDLPLLPRDCARRLAKALGSHACCYGTTGDSHALAVLWAPGAAEAILTEVDADNPRVHAVLERLGVPAAFAPLGDEDLGLNLNTPEDWARAEQRLKSPPTT